MERFPHNCARTHTFFLRKSGRKEGGEGSRQCQGDREPRVETGLRAGPLPHPVRGNQQGSFLLTEQVED